MSHSKRSRMQAIIRLLWGTGLLVAPDAVVSDLGGQSDRASEAVFRVLGARHIIQAVVEMLLGPRGRRAGVAIDAAHAATAFATAVISRRWRRVALADTAAAAAFAFAGRKG